MRREKKEASGSIDRRRLLTGAGLAIGAASASSAIACEQTVSAAQEPKSQNGGYRESELVKTYYRLARS